MRRMIGDNRDYFGREGIQIVKSSIEDHQKYGKQLIIIVKVENDGNSDM